MAPAIDIMDESFVVAAPETLAARFADPALCREWWPGLLLSIARDRGPKGVRWTVGGELTGSAEIWLEPWRDGVIVHWYLRAESTCLRAEPTRPWRARRPDRSRESYVRAYKRRIHALKDELERDRPCGTPRLDQDR